ncbi:hypothetical protein RFI_31464 [Reticulomyxa filosa]|uniref:Uncharacterized protein n=1 Tax=Reticulomyxa filosa TaxID=46433 RepID=X6LWE7_RETFI|nr:hypothetical protein RFI_31464 [Reticulomyxa filosa]|eukprot:ETO05929.1 hypothetical protein RFI_31464 [Reticulomyxa filosa]
MKYSCKHIANTFQWSRIHSFGFLQGQESMNSSRPINSVYFPHLTFQEWLAAYYLVHCLYEPVESDDHKQVCSILINEQLNATYSMVIPFMAGILYHNIENKKILMDLVYYIFGNTDSSFLQSQIQDYHKAIINSFKSSLNAWLNFDKAKDGNKYRIVHQSLHKEIERYLFNLQYILIHPAIHVYIMCQLTFIENTDRNIKLVNRLKYLSISPQTSKIVIQYCQRGFQDKDDSIRKIYMNTFESIALKTQMNDIFEILLNGLHNEDKYIHMKCAKLIEETSWNMNEKQLHNIFESLMIMFDQSNILLCESCSKAFGTIIIQLDTKQIDDALECILSQFKKKDTNIIKLCGIILEIIVTKLNEKQVNYIFGCLLKKFEFEELLEKILLKLNERQLNYIFKYLINGLKNGQKTVILYYTKLLEKITMILNQGQLNIAFNHLMNKLINNKNKIVHNSYEKLYKIISSQLNKTYKDISFKYLTDGLQHKKQFVRNFYANMIMEISIKWNKMQLDNFVMYLISNKSKYKNKHICYLYAQTIQKLLLLQLQWNKKQLNDDIFNYLINGLRNDKNKNIQYLSAELIGRISKKLNNKQINIVWKYLMNKLNDSNEDMLVCISCAESLGRISIKLNNRQLKKTLEYLIDKISNDSYDGNIFVHKYCTHSIEKILSRLKKTDINKLFIDSLGMILIKYKERQFDDIISCLMNGLNSENISNRLYIYIFFKELNSDYANVCEVYKKGLQKIVLKLNVEQLQNLLGGLIQKCIKKNWDAHYVCVDIFDAKLSKLDDQSLFYVTQCIDYGICHYDTNIQKSYIKILQMTSTQLSEEQINNLFTTFKYKIDYCSIVLSKLNNQQLNNIIEYLKDRLHLCEDIIQKITLKLNKQSLNESLECLKSGFKDNNIWFLISCAKLIQSLSNGKQIHNSLYFLVDIFNNKNDPYLYNLYKETFQIIVLELNMNQLNNLINFFLIEQNAYQNILRQILEIILSNFNEQQINYISEILVDELNNKDRNIVISSLKGLEMISLRLNKKQSSNLFDYLNKEFKNRDSVILSKLDDQSRNISEKVEKRLLAHIYKLLINKFNFDGNIIDLCIKIHKNIMLKLDDKQLCLLINNFLRIFGDISVRQRNRVNLILSNITDDIWERIIISSLKENMKIKMRKNIKTKLLTFGLLLFNPRIQHNYNDHDKNIINSKAFNELKNYYNKQIIKWKLPIQPLWDKDNNIYDNHLDDDISQSKYSSEEHYCIFDINNSFNQYGKTLLHVAIYKKNWNIVRYCIEQGAWIDVRERGPDAILSQTPCGYISELIEKEKNNEKQYLEIVEICKWILKKRIVYPIKQIGYAISYIKDNLIGDESYQTLLIESIFFLFGMNQELKDIFLEDLFRNENRQLYAIAFLRYRIFLLFEICIRLKQDKEYHIELPKNTTLEQLIEKGLKELQIQLTTYWDYITAVKLCNTCPDLLDDWSLNVVDRLMSSNDEYYEMSLMIGSGDHAIYLSLCKISKHILVRIDHLSMDNIPSNTPHPKNKHGWIQPYLIAHFLCNSINIDNNKEWLKNYIKYAFILRNSGSDESMKHLYCSDSIQSSHSTPREGKLPSIVKNWPYHSVQTNSNNCHNIGYQIRLGDDIYQWFRNQECKSLVFNKNHHNIDINEQKEDQQS